MTTELKVEDFLQYIQQSRSKSTLKEYKAGINKFSEYFGKTPNEILEMRRQDWISADLHEKRRFGRELEKFHRWLITDQPNRKAYSINSARTLCLGLRQLFRYFEMPMNYVSREISRTVMTTKDFIPTIAQLRKMFTVADKLRDRVIINMGLNLGWRVGDFRQIKKDMLPNLDEETPILFELITEKEDVIAKSFLSFETVELLKAYLPTLPKENPYLFPSNSQKCIDADTINRNLRSLAKKASIHIPRGKRLRFHAFRKRLLSEASNLRIDINCAKILVGKSVSKDMLTYLSEVDHKAAFLRLQGRLRLTETKVKPTASQSELEAKVAELEAIIHGVYVAGGAKYVEDSKRLVASFLKSKLHANPQMVKQQLEKLEGASGIEVLAMLGKIDLDRQQAQYRKLIEDNNNNHS